MTWLQYTCECMRSHTPCTPCTITSVSACSKTTQYNSHTSLVYPSLLSPPPSIRSHFPPLHPSRLLITSLPPTPHYPSSPSPPHSLTHPTQYNPLHFKLLLHLIVPLLTGPQLVCGTNKSKLLTLLPMMLRGLKVGVNVVSVRMGGTCTMLH